jgi:hypothetical protein
MQGFDDVLAVRPGAIHPDGAVVRDRVQALMPEVDDRTTHRCYREDE